MALKLLIGADRSAPLYEFGRGDIRERSCQIVTAVDVIGSELSADELDVNVDYTVGEYVWFSPADYDGVMSSDGYIFAAADQTADLTLVPYATPVWLIDGNDVLHEFFFAEAKQIDARTYAITAVSGVGLLEKRRHLGGLYKGQTVGAVLAEIIGNAFPYTVASDVAAQQVFGVLLPGTARENLHQLLFALGISIIKGQNGAVQFVFLPQAEAGTIPDSRVFTGGTISYEMPATAVEVTEHSYFVDATVEEETLFDNRQDKPASNLVVEFDGPYFDLTATSGLTIVSSGATYAVVSGLGIITGKPYTHTTRIVQWSDPDAEGGERVIKSSSDCLVNALNSRSVLDRLAAYYQSDRKVSLSVKIAGEKAGQNVSFALPFGGTASGFVEQAVARVGGFQRAELKIITGYIPTGQGNYYTHKVLVTANGTWSVPTGVKHIRLVLIQGGTGGQGGKDGEDGAGESDLNYTGGTYSARHYYAGQTAAAGGERGDPGDPGAVYIEDYDVDSGLTITFYVGAGGAGGAAGGTAGSAGGHTTASATGISASSADGVVGYGYADPFTGDVYGIEGEEGHDGGDGGTTDTNTLDGDSGANGRSGGDAGTYAGGSGGSGITELIPIWDDYGSYGGVEARVSGGGGGGAAWGANGGVGGNGRADHELAHGGNGGAGANAATPTTPSYGCGGGGGNGGGGGGNGAGMTLEFTDPDHEQHYASAAGSPGPGGRGSAGGTGGAGVAIIYY